MLRHQAKGSFPPRRRPSQFFASRSFSAALSSIDSASSFFRRRFSSSSPFSRAASDGRSEEHTSELQSLMRISYAVFCLKKKKLENTNRQHNSIYIDRHKQTKKNTHKRRTVKSKSETSKIAQHSRT